MSRNCAYSFWPRSSDHVYGSANTVMGSLFCIRTFYSKNLKRCFEVDSSRDCSDGYFLHNCENVSNSLLCFNAKNLSHSVGNTPVGKDKFAKAKAMLLEWINGQLDRKKEVPLSIYNLKSN